MSDSPQIRTTDGQIFEIEKLAHRGEDFEIALAVRAGHDGTADGGSASRVALRSIRIDDAWPPEVRNNLDTRRQTECRAASLLLGDSPLAPSLVAVDGSIDFGDSASLVVHRYVDGTTLERYVHAHHPEGMPLDEGLAIARSLAEQLVLLHEERLVHRSPSPAHVIVDEAGNTQLIGFGNVCERQTRPNPWQLRGDGRYVAPEILRERSGTFIHPRADIYTFGATLSYLFSGVHPTETPEAPIANDSWRRLMEQPEGLRLLIAHCMQPMHKNRLINASKLLPLLSADTLPTRRTEGFGAIALLAPWTGALEGKSSGLSPGPLTTRQTQQAAAQASSERSATEPQEPTGSDDPPARGVDDDPGRAEVSSANADGDASVDSPPTPVPVQTTGVRRSRLLLGFGLIAAVVLGGALLRLCGS